LVYSIHDSTEVAIQKMIDASQRMITVNSQVQRGAKEGWGINPVIKKHLELEIKAELGAVPLSLRLLWTNHLKKLAAALVVLWLLIGLVGVYGIHVM
jgi:hypothetical protein